MKINIKEDSAWAFKGLMRKELSYASHGYHHYPAKFIPQLVRKLIQELTGEGDTVVDPFGGCGTSLVEAALLNRIGVSFDVNDVAVMISKAKKQPINPAILDKENSAIVRTLLSIRRPVGRYRNAVSRLQYWYTPSQYNWLAAVADAIDAQTSRTIKSFYKCCLSNILKQCSMWHPKSIKPQRALTKKPIHPRLAFTKHLAYMTHQNLEFFKLAQGCRKSLSNSKVYRGDARQLPLHDGTVNLVVSSPPYVTSYEYADLHQLSTLWFRFASDMQSIKDKFVGSSKYRIPTYADLCDTEIRLIDRIGAVSKSSARKLACYYGDMNRSIREMQRILKPKGTVAVVVGDTKYHGIRVPNTKLIANQLEKHGLKTLKLIKRRLQLKNFTPYRDQHGRFSASRTGTRVYQHEYIIIAQKH